MKKTTKASIFFGVCLFFVLSFSENTFSETNKYDICDIKMNPNIDASCEDFKIENILKEKEEGRSISVMSLKSSSYNGFVEKEVVDIDDYEEWDGDKTVENKRIMINPGAELKIKAGSTITLENVILVAYGKLTIEGTSENKVYFKSKNSNGRYIIGVSYDSETETVGEMNIQYADISGGGLYGETYGTIYAEAGKLKFENCTFHNNEGGILGGYVLAGSKINHNKFYDNDWDVTSLISKDYLPEEDKDLISFDFKYNWWGSVNGPEKDEEGNYKKIIGDAEIDPWFSSEDFYDPVLIIPGITGSFKVGDTWKLDPILHTYDNLVASFEKNGYTKNKNLFEFPYEWRNSNVITAESLKEKIQEIKDDTGIPRVNIVAHSMGGLVARYYIESDFYQNDINNLITLGTPHKGSPKSYPRWEAAEGFFEADEMIMKQAFWLEALHAGYLNLKDYIQARVLSVKELLPDYSYLKEAGNEELRIYPENYPQNTFLEFLNNENQLAKLKNVNFINIIGNIIDSEKTITSFNVVESSEDGKWEHGMPENFYDSAEERGIEYGSGDETVPLSSANGIISDKTQELNISHNNLPTEAQCNAIQEILGREECEYIDTFERIINMLTFSVFSPIDIQIISPSGLRVGKDFKTEEILNEIDGAYYSGWDTENEFLTIPNPEKGGYQILTRGTESGDYKIETTNIYEDENSGEVKEISNEISGTTYAGKDDTTSMSLGENEIIFEQKDSTPPSILINSPENDKIYLNNQILALNYEIQDNKSSVDKIAVEVYFDEELFDGTEINLPFENLGEHSIKISAIDEAGNQAGKEIKFISETNLSAIEDNINLFYKQRLIKDKKDKMFLISEIKFIEDTQRLIEMIKNCFFLKEKRKRMFVRELEKQINMRLNWMQDYLRRESNRKFKHASIDDKAARLLIESLEFIKYK